MTDTKRYIVSFEDEKTTVNAAAQVLSVPKKKITDGVRALIEDIAPKEDAILHFEGIGSSVVALSEDDAERLRHDDRVAQVNEDIEVFALSRHICGQTEAPEFWNAHPRVDQLHAGQDQVFEAGYAQAIADMLRYGAAESGIRSTGPKSQAGCPPNSQPFCFSWFGFRYCFCIPSTTPPQDQKIPWNIQMVRADSVWDRVTGAGVRVAVIDTGIDNDHPDLSVKGGASFVPGVGPWNDDQGHGTHCAGIVGARNNRLGVVGVAPGCELYAVKVLNRRGSGQLSWILAGMGWAAENKMNVASMSLGSNVDDPDVDCLIAYQRAARELHDVGCIVVAASGNNGRESNPWVGQPARCPAYMAVAAVDSDRNLADFSSRGPSSLCAECGVEISAPGVSVRSTTVGGGYGEKSGTSMACPHVAGAAALLLEQHPTWTPARVRERLTSTAQDLGAPGADPGTGAGLLDCHSAVFG
jgi:subtilisin